MTGELRPEVGKLRPPEKMLWHGSDRSKTLALSLTPQPG
jgi:hypothetical protein